MITKVWLSEYWHKCLCSYIASQVDYKVRELGCDYKCQLYIGHMGKIELLTRGRVGNKISLLLLLLLFINIFI